MSGRSSTHSAFPLRATHVGETVDFSVNSCLPTAKKPRRRISNRDGIIEPFSEVICHVVALCH
jgi:hypothetical protein